MICCFSSLLHCLFAGVDVKKLEDAARFYREMKDYSRDQAGELQYVRDNLQHDNAATVRFCIHFNLIDTNELLSIICYLCGWERCVQDFGQKDVQLFVIWGLWFLFTIGLRMVSEAEINVMGPAAAFNFIFQLVDSLTPSVLFVYSGRPV